MLQGITRSSPRVGKCREESKSELRPSDGHVVTFASISFFLCEEQLLNWERLLITT